MVVCAVVVWAGERLNGRGLSAYDIFPLLGLGAFSLMWTHYVLGSLRRLWGIEKQANETYFRYTSIVVLAMILLHPGILVAQLYKDGFGLPPQSYLEAYAAMQFAILLGSLSLMIFLLFEFKKKFQSRSWWQYVEWGQVAAMCFIFLHGLSLGRELSVGWYMAVWYVYGLSLLAAVSYNYWYDKGEEKRRSHGAK